MVGEKLGSFRIEGTLGVGAMGVVYKAIHEPSGKEAAVKVIAKELAARGNAYDRFEREANILKQFRHPNIVRFLALGRSQGTSYIAMEFIPGRTLDDVLEGKGVAAVAGRRHAGDAVVRRAALRATSTASSTAT